MAGPPVRFSDRRVAKVGGALVAARVEGTLGSPTNVTLVDAKGIRRTTLDVDADWWPGSPLWRGQVRQAPRVRCRCAPILNGYDLAYRGMPRQGLRLHRARGGAGRADAGEGRAPIPPSCCSARCRAWSRRSTSPHGQEVKAGEALCVVEAMKMENILRAERDGGGQVHQGQGRRQPGGRCRDHGVCVGVSAAAQRATACTRFHKVAFRRSGRVEPLTLDPTALAYCLQWQHGGHDQLEPKMILHVAGAASALRGRVSCRVRDCRGRAL